MAKCVTVIDIGSNSVRMVIYEKTSRFAFHQLHEEKSKVRISENAYKHEGNLQIVPMQRTFDALRDFLVISESFNSRKILCVATSALRDAPNRLDFIHKVKKELKLNIKVISGEKEAYFGAIACANLLPMQTSALSIDIGGGSTELSYIDKNNVSDTISLNLGTVRLKELYFDNGDIDGATSYIDMQLENLKEKQVSTLIGIGGTFRAISNAIMQNSDYPLDKIHAYEYSHKTFQKFIKDVLVSNEKELIKLGIKENRFDIIKPGALILQRLINRLDISKLITSGVGVREGVYLSDLLRNSKHKFPHNYNTSVRYLLDKNIQNNTFSNQISSLSKKLFDLTREYLNLDEQYRYHLATAAKLYPIGSSLHFYSQNKHTYYLIQTALEYGFTHKCITLISTLCKYAKNKLPAESHLEKYSLLLPNQKTTIRLSYLLSLSIALLSHRPRNVNFDITFNDGTIEINSKDKLYITKDSVSKLVSPTENLSIKFNS